MKFGKLLVVLRFLPSSSRCNDVFTYEVRTRAFPGISVAEFVFVFCWSDVIEV